MCFNDTFCFSVGNFLIWRLYEDTLDPIYYKEALLIIRLILDRLPERRRKVFEMSRINNMSNMEIAQALNISVRTVEHQIYLTLLEIKKTIFIAFFLCFF